MWIWLRLAGLLLISAAALGALDYFGFGARVPDDAPDPVQARPRELFWAVIFIVVMATSLLAAARRGAGHLRRALSRH